MHKVNQPIFYKKILGFFCFVGLICILFSSSASADYREFPDQDGNKDDEANKSLNGIVSTGTIGRFGTAKDPIVNDFYGPEMWIKVYRGKDSNQQFSIDFGNTRRSEICRDRGVKLDHTSQIRLNFFSTDTKGELGKVISVPDPNSKTNKPVTHVEFESNDLCSNTGGLQGLKYIQLSQAWQNPNINVEEESDKQVILIQIRIFQHVGNGDLDNLPASDESHLLSSPNHPLARFYIKSTYSEGPKFGSWGLFNGGLGAESVDNFIGPADKDSRKNMLNTQVKAYNKINGELKREFTFSPSCNYFSKQSGKEKNVWLKWFDDDVDLSKPQAHMEMLIQEKKIGSSNGYVTIKTIRGYNERKDVVDRNVPKDKNNKPETKYLQKNMIDKSDEYVQGSDKDGEGFGGKGQPGRARITVREGYVYKWIYRATNPNEQLPLNLETTDPGDRYEHRYGNKIAMWMPFDTAFAEDPSKTQCDPPPPKGSCNLIKYTVPQDKVNPVGSGNSVVALYINDGGTPGGPNQTENDRFKGTFSRYSKLGKDLQPGEGTPTDYRDIRKEGTDIEFDLVNDDKFDSSKIVSGQLKYTIITYDRTDKDITIRERKSETINDCYTASCTVDVLSNIVNAPPGSGAVEAGKPFTVRWTLTNHSSHALFNTIYVKNNNLSFDSPLSLTVFNPSIHNNYPPPYKFGIDPVFGNWSWNGWYQMGANKDYIWPGQTIERYETFYAQSNFRSDNFVAYPDYWMKSFPMGEACTDKVNVYQEFNITPDADAKLLPEEEDPSSFQYTHSWKKDYGPTVLVTGAKHIWEKGSNGVLGAHTEILPQPSSSSDYTKVDSKPVSNVSAGDQYCAQTWINRAHGWRGPGGDNDVVGSTDASGPSPPDCDTVSNKPYLRVYGNDVSAGGGFGEQSGGAGGIKTNFSATKNGSGVQFAAFALDAINNFSSGTLISDANLPSKVDTFANNFGVASGSLGDLGGSFGSDIKATDFYDITKIDSGDEVETRTSRNISVNSLSKLQTHVNGDVDLGGGDIAGRKGLYVDGDVYIKGDIKYPDDISGLPYFALIVKGNIYIDPSVTRLDGLYVAQPDGASGGQIVTCANSSGVLTNYDNPGCRNKLTINGAFVAKSVRFLRTLDSLRYSSRTDDAITRDHAAEIFNFSPEMYLGTPPFKNEGVGAGSGSTGPYDSIMTLPPIL